MARSSPSSWVWWGLGLVGVVAVGAVVFVTRKTNKKPMTRPEEKPPKPTFGGGGSDGSGAGSNF